MSQMKQLFGVTLLFTIVFYLLFFCLACSKTETKSIGCVDYNIGNKIFQKVNSEVDWYNSSNIQTIACLDTALTKDFIAWEENPCDSTRLIAFRTLRRYVEIGSTCLIPDMKEPINSEVFQQENERAGDLRSFRTMIFWRIMFAKENGICSLEESNELLNLAQSKCPAIVLIAILENSNTPDLVFECEEVLKAAVRISTSGRFLYECSLILEYYETLKDFSWYQPMAESALQTLLEKNPERVILLKNNVAMIKGGKEAIVSAQKLLVSR